MAIVATYNFGKCNTFVDDSYVVKTPEEVKSILNKLYTIYEILEMMKAKAEKAKKEIRLKELCKTTNTAYAKLAESNGM